MKKRILLIVLCVLYLLPTLSGCSKSAATQTTAATAATDAAVTEPAQPDNLHRYGGHADIPIDSISGVDPLVQTGYEKYQWTTLVLEGALTRDVYNNIQPGVCNYTISEDHLTLTLWVVEGTKFHNGDLVDIYDVEASFQRAFNRYNSIISKVVPYVKSMEVDASGQVLTLTFTQWREDVYYYLAAYRTWCPVMPKEICETYNSKSLGKNYQDCIGTGPYMITGYKHNKYIEMARFDDYQVRENGLTGFAGPKYAYLDTITFWQESSDTATVQGLMNGTYTISDCMTPEYASQVEAKNLATSSRDNSAGWFIYFNTYGRKAVTAKYPSLRKAAMAAIDMEALLNKLTGGQYAMAKTPILDSTYDLDTFQSADYYGAPNQAAVDKYLEAAKAEGWNGTDPLVLVPFGSNTSAETLILSNLQDAGIPVTLIENEDAKATSWRKDRNNQWDLYFHNTGFGVTPTLLQDVIVHTYWNSADKDTLLIKMKLQKSGSPEYMEYWQKLAQLWVDECAIGFLGFETGVLYHDPSFHNNEDEGSMQRYWFNAYWDDPQAHVKQTQEPA